MIFYKLLVIFILQLPFVLIHCQQIEQDYNKIRTIVIDAGHGGKDPGALGKKSKEKDIVLSIALKTGAYIEKNLPEVKVIYTRTTDIFIPLNKRADIANKNHADLFISIHANSNTNPKPFGSETFVMGLHKTQGNLEVAMKENSVITFEEDYKTKYEGFDPNDVESYIMLSVVQDIYQEHSLTAASLIQDQFRERAKRKDRGVSPAGFLVLWKTSTPSILIETGFISNPKEEEYLISEQGQDYLASAIFRAFRDYKTHIEGSTSTNTIEKNEVITQVSTQNSEMQEIGSVEQTDTSQPEFISVTKDSSVEDLNTVIDMEEYNIDTQTSANPVDTKFKIQILYSENQVDLNSELFKDFNDVEEIKSSGKFKYVVGSAQTYTEAVEYSKWVKNRYPDAFIVAVSKGKIVPLAQALEEKRN
jgi:N-acetylmuramoyl-L-alanine amidase